VYLGKAEKIKKTLIHKAKLKKQRAKELAKAGYDTAEPAASSSHLGEHDEQEQTTSSSHEDPAPRRRPKPIPPLQRPNGTASPPTTHSLTHASSSRPHLPPQKPPQNRPSTAPPAHTTLLTTRIKPPKTQAQHANGQPKMAHRVHKILSKLEHEKALQSP